MLNQKEPLESTESRLISIGDSRLNASGRSRIFLKEVPTPKVGVLTYYFAKFCEDCMKMKESGHRGRPWGPLDPPMNSLPFTPLRL